MLEYHSLVFRSQRQAISQNGVPIQQEFYDEKCDELMDLWVNFVVTAKIAQISVYNHIYTNKFNKWITYDEF